MANMSYCRMENTLQDLRDVYENWEETHSEREVKSRDKILQLCREIIATYDEEGEYVKHEKKPAN